MCAYTDRHNDRCGPYKSGLAIGAQMLFPTWVVNSMVVDLQITPASSRRKQGRFFERISNGLGSLYPHFDAIYRYCSDATLQDFTSQRL